MKRTNAKTLTIVDLIKLNRETLAKIKKGNKSLSFDPIKKGQRKEGEEEYTVQDNAVLLIAQIIKESTDNLKEGLRILKEAKETFIGYHSEDES